MDGKCILVMVLSSILLLHCKKEHVDNRDMLVNRTWKKGLTDRNKKTNPSGKIIYAAVNDCEKDDIYQFMSDGKLLISSGKEKCKIYQPETSRVTYDLNREAMTLTINGAAYQLAELSSEQIKYVAPLPSGSGYDFIIFLLQ